MRRFYYTAVAVFAATPVVAFAQGETDFTYDRVVRILFGLVNFLFDIAMLLAVIAIIWYGIKMMTAGGNATRYQEAKNALIWAVVGAAVILGVNTLLATIESVVVKQSITG